MNLRDRISRGVKALLGARLVYVGSNALLLVVLTRYLLTPAGYGLLYFGLSVLSVGAMFAMLGLPKATGRYITEFAATDETQVPHVIRIALRSLLVLSLIVGGILALVHTRLAVLLGEPAVAPLLLLGSVFVGVRALFTLLTNIFQGFNRVEFSAMLSAINGSGRVVFTVGFVLLGFGVVGALAGYLAGYLAGVVVGFVVLRDRILVDYDSAAERVDGLRRRILEYSVPTAATRASVVLDSRVDKVLIGMLVGPAAVGYYTLASQIANFCIAPARSLGFTISPAIGEQSADDETETARRLYERSMENVLLLYLPAAVGLLLVAEPAIEVIFGAAYLGAVPVLQLFSVFIVVRAIHKITGNGLDYLGLAKVRAVARGTTAIGNVVLNLLLIPPYGIVGATVATLVTYTTYTAINVVYINRELDLRVGYLLKQSGQIGVIAVVMGVAVQLVLPSLDGLVGLSMAVLTGLIVWGVLSVASGLVDPTEVRSFLA